MNGILEVPEDLQIIKPQQCNSKIEKSPNKNSPPDIKVRLNLHVKRRLQQESTIANCNLLIPPAAITEDNNEVPLKIMKLNKNKNVQGVQKQCEKISMRTPSTNGTCRKISKKQKVKDNKSAKACGTDDTNDLDGNCSEEDEEDQPASPLKDKSSDVLEMVLGLKKRSLLQHPDVKELLTNIMKVIKED